jgi:CubicO group peptidase (beta-lactamase class C family)
MADYVHAARLSNDGTVTVVGSPSAIFPWWSFTKTVLAICSLRLAEEGVIDLDAPRPGKPYTLRQLLQHRAGVPDYGWRAAYQDAVARGDAPWSRAKLLDEVQADQLDFAPGTGWSYSNVGYMFVREAIEQASGLGIAEAVKLFVTAPLQLQSVELATTSSDLRRTPWPTENYDPGWVYHGCLIGRSRDAATLLHALFQGKLLRAATLRSMMDACQLGGTIPGRPWTSHGYGLGLMSAEVDAAGRAIGHSGAGPFSANAVYHFPDLANPVTVATFTEGSNEAPAESAALRLASEITQ